MTDLASLKRRYPEYQWGERYRWGRILTGWLVLFGIILILLGLALPAVLMTGRIPLSYAASTRTLLSVAVLLVGIIFGSTMFALGELLRVYMDNEQNTRRAMNIWFILEEQDLAPVEEELPEEEPVPEEPPRD